MHCQRFRKFCPKLAKAKNTILKNYWLYPLFTAQPVTQWGGTYPLSHSLAGFAGRIRLRPSRCQARVVTKAAPFGPCGPRTNP